MNRVSLKLAACASVLLLAGFASADWVAKIYGAPSGFSSMVVKGAGDNGVMSGWGTSGVTTEAGYLTNSGFKNLHPAGWNMSLVNDSWGTSYHGGLGREVGGGNSRALFWVGGGAAVNLHPAGAEYVTSEVNGGGGQLQAGSVGGTIACPECGITVSAHAGTWSRTAASFRRIHSIGHSAFVAEDTDGVQIVGRGVRVDNSQLEALLWTGPATMAINLHPTGYASSEAFAVWGSQQGGLVAGVATGFEQHAAIWSGSAASMVDLNPTGVFQWSRINAIRNGTQVGHGVPFTTPARTQAIAWRGVAGTWINLHHRLPYPFNRDWNSSAEGINAQGQITGYVYSPALNVTRPVIWTWQN